MLISLSIIINCYPGFANHWRKPKVSFFQNVDGLKTWLAKVWCTRMFGWITPRILDSRYIHSGFPSSQISSLLCAHQILSAKHNCSGDWHSDQMKRGVESRQCGYVSKGTYIALNKQSFYSNAFVSGNNRGKFSWRTQKLPPSGQALWPVEV